MNWWRGSKNYSPGANPPINEPWQLMEGAQLQGVLPKSKSRRRMDAGGQEQSVNSWIIAHFHIAAPRTAALRPLGNTPLTLFLICKVLNHKHKSWAVWRFAPCP